MSDNKVLGEYKLTKFIITNNSKKTLNLGVAQVEMGPIIKSWSLTESVNSGYIRGSAIIHDTKNIIQNFPLNGEELIEVEYEDYFGKSLKHYFYLYSIEINNINWVTNDQLQEYTIYFCSLSGILDKTQLVRKSFEGKISDNAKLIFETYMLDLIKAQKIILDKNAESIPVPILDVEETNDIQRLVIPSYSPIDSMHFLSRYSYNHNGSSQYKFFENREKFYFASTEYVANNSIQKQKKGLEMVMDSIDKPSIEKSMANIHEFFLNSPHSFEPGEIDYRPAQILGIRYGNIVNIANEYNTGMEHRRIINLDFNFHEVTGSTVKFPNEIKQNITGQTMFPKHSSIFVQNRFPEPYDVWLPKDWTDTQSYNRINPWNETIYGQKKMQGLHEEANHIELTIYGRNTLFAGDVIKLTVPYFSEREEYEVDKEREGFYLVTSITNTFVFDGYKQALKITRVGGLENMSYSALTGVIRITPDERIGQPTYGPGSGTGYGQQGYDPGGKGVDGGGTVTFAEAEKLALEAGFTPEEARVMAAIAMAESSGNPNAYNGAGRDNSYGLWQINMYGSMGPDRAQQFGLSSYDQLYNPSTNANAAYGIYKQQGFGAWSTYSSGAYLRYLGG